MKNPASRCTVWTHAPHEGPGLLAHVMEERNFCCTIIDVTSAAFLENPDGLDADLLLVMGGPMGVYERDSYPFITREREILRARIAKDRPTLGICLGAQLIAAAAGASVYKGTAGPEYGWHDLTLTPEAVGTPVELLAGPMFHAHGDTFDMPRGGRLLASTKRYKQIFTLGANILALQCHPELTQEGLAEWGPPETWLPTHGLAADWSAEEFSAQTRRNIEGLNRRTLLFFNAWLDSVGL